MLSTLFRMYGSTTTAAFTLTHCLRGAISRYTIHGRRREQLWRKQQLVMHARELACHILSYYHDSRMDFASFTAVAPHPRSEDKHVTCESSNQVAVYPFLALRVKEKKTSTHLKPMMPSIHPPRTILFSLLFFFYFSSLFNLLNLISFRKSAPLDLDPLFMFYIL